MAMSREMADRCANCGVAFVIGPIFVDYIDKLRKRGLRRTFEFDYRFYCEMFGHEDVECLRSVVDLSDCDSVFLGDLIDTEMTCPKCGDMAFADASSPPSTNGPNGGNAS